MLATLATHSMSPIPEAGILGGLAFGEETHAWALDVGGQLMRYDLLSGSLMDDSVSGISNARLELVANINRWLERGQLSTRVTAIVPNAKQIHDVADSLLSEMRRAGMQTHLAFLLIGSANFALSMADASSVQRLAREQGGKNEMISLAENRLTVLDIEWLLATRLLSILLELSMAVLEMAMDSRYDSLLWS